MAEDVRMKIDAVTVDLVYSVLKDVVSNFLPLRREVIKLLEGRRLPSHG